MDKLAAYIAAIVTAGFAGIGGLAILLFISFLMSLPVWLLWNGSFVGAVSGVNEITWLQAWGINFLFGMLFRSNRTTEIKQD